MNKYKEIFEELYEVTGSRVSSLEFLYLLSGIKDVSRLTMRSSHITLFSDLCKRNNLSFLFSEESYTVPVASSYRNSLDKTTESLGFCYKEVYISRTVNKVHDLKEAAANCDHRHVGRILGYPDCCIDFFMSWLALGQLNNMDFSTFASSDGKEYPYRVNVFSKEFDACYLSHFPCSLNCVDSLNQAKERMLFVKNNLPNIESMFIKKMKSCVAYSSRFGTIYSKGFITGEEGALIITPKEEIYINGKLGGAYDKEMKLVEIAQEVWSNIEKNQIKTVAFI